MSNLIGVIGESGTGKSTSIELLNPEETVIINVAGKPLPFKGFKTKYKGKISEKGNIINSSNPDTIIKGLKLISDTRPDIKTIVIDDFQYIMSFEFMEKAKEKGYEKYNVLAKNTFDVINTAKNLREDLNIIILSHSEATEYGIRMKTIGKMLESKVTLEGLFTVMLMTKVEKTPEGLKYYFVTQNEGDTVCKSPRGMFDDLLIANDLNYVIKKVNEYFY
jgi:hypothetical protein